MAYEKLKSETYELLGGINSKASPYVNGPQEFRDLTNLNFMVPGALSQRPGSSLYVGATVAGRITGGVEFERLNGASYIVVSANTNVYSVTNTFTPIKAGVLNNALFDFVTFVDRLFACNGQDFFKTDGVNVASFSLPQGISGFGVTAVVGGSMTAGVTGVFLAGYGYLNDRGYYGPSSQGLTITLNGITFNSIGYYGLTSPSGYGISSIALYRSSAGGVDLTGTTHAPVGTTTVSDTGFPLTTRIDTAGIHLTLAPRYMEIYNNQLFMAGFSSLPSTVIWSDVGEPELIDPSFTAEFRTNDGDRVTGLKNYNASIVIAKERSFHRVVGDNPDNFLLQELSDQYGCLSNRAMVVFEDRLWFLDSKGIVEYNGSGVRVVSNKVEPIFRSMNVEAARDNALAIHVREFNEVWFSIPTNGSSVNNTIVVYDYLTDAWTKYEGLTLSHLFIAKGGLASRTPFFGGYTGTVSFFGASLVSDNGQAITCMMDTRFLAATGQTVEREYRRFYVNLEPVLGITLPMSVNFRTNYGTSIALSRTMYQNPFQARLDFGLSAKSIQAELTYASASFPIRIYGFAFESRFMRNV